MWKIIVYCVLYIVPMSLAIDRVSYEGYKLFSVLPKTYTQLQLLEDLKEDTEYSYWRKPTSINEEAFLMVHPRNLKQFYRLMNGYKIYILNRINNIQELINDTLPHIPSKFDFKSYHTLEEIYDNLEELAQKYRDNVQVVVGGTTYEGRKIKGVVISRFSYVRKHEIFIEGGMHGREWIAPATVMYILHELLTSKDSQVQYIAQKYNWHIFPVFNPDGYVYSHVRDRLWKKTRTPFNDYHFCYGADPNKNWGFRWSTSGFSSHPCAEDYPGSEAFSEKEMDTISQYMANTHTYFNVYISFHSFFQELLFSCDNKTEHEFYNRRYFAEKAVKALENRYGTEYVTGCIDKNPLVGGSSTGYVAGVFNKRFVFRYNLPDKGQYGFLLPPEQIIPTGKETLESVIKLLSELANVL